MRALLDAILPRECLSCSSKLLEFEDALCTPCFESLEFYNAEMDHMSKPEALFKERLNVISANSLLSYRAESTVSILLKELKYHQKKNVAHFLGRELATRYGDLFSQDSLVTYVPLHPKKERLRGYNQAKEIALVFSDILGLEVKTTLKRVVHSDSQTKQSRLGRSEALEQVFVGVKDIVEGKNVILIDDVLTTGATTITCGKILREFNNSVNVLTAAVAVN